MLIDGRSLRDIYRNKGLNIPDDFSSTRTVPPMHFIEYVYIHVAVSFFIPVYLVKRIEANNCTV